MLTSQDPVLVASAISANVNEVTAPLPRTPTVVPRTSPP